MHKKVSLGKDKRRKTSPWIVRWFGPPDPCTGKQRWYSKAFSRKIDAERFLAEKMKDIAMGIPQERVEPGTIRTFCKEWFSVKRKSWSPANYDLYTMAQRRLEDFFGKDRKLPDVTHRAAELFISSQKSLSKNIKEPRELSEFSLQQLTRQCRAIFQAAIKWGHIQSNPFDGITLAKPVVPQWTKITPEDYHKLLKVAPTLRWKAFYALAYTSGARSGELLALTWDQIDFEKNMLTIESRQASGGIPPFKVKDHEARSIPLPQHTMDILTRWQNEAPEGVPYVLLTKERYELVKAKWKQLCKQKRPWRNCYMTNNVLRDFKAHCKKAGIKPNGKLNIHTLRKSCCQNWADHLPVAVTKELMGHSSVSTTLKFYNQVDQLHREQAANAIQKLLEVEEEVQS